MRAGDKGVLAAFLDGAGITKQTYYENFDSVSDAADALLRYGQITNKMLAVSAHISLKELARLQEDAWNNVNNARGYGLTVRPFIKQAIMEQLIDESSGQPTGALDANTRKQVELARAREATRQQEITINVEKKRAARLARLEIERQKLKIARERLGIAGEKSKVAKNLLTEKQEIERKREKRSKEDKGEPQILREWLRGDGNPRPPEERHTLMRCVHRSGVPESVVNRACGAKLYRDTTPQDMAVIAALIWPYLVDGKKWSGHLDVADEQLGEHRKARDYLKERFVELMPNRSEDIEKLFDNPHPTLGHALRALRHKACLAKTDFFRASSGYAVFDALESNSYYSSFLDEEGKLKAQLQYLLSVIAEKIAENWQMREQFFDAMRIQPEEQKAHAEERLEKVLDAFCRDSGHRRQEIAILMGEPLYYLANRLGGQSKLTPEFITKLTEALKSIPDKRRYKDNRTWAEQVEKDRAGRVRED